MDVDGTLVDTNYQHARWWYRAFREHDVVLPVWRLHRHVGMGAAQAVRVQAPRKRGVETLCLVTGGFSEQESRDPGAAAVFESVQELRDSLERTPLS